MAEPRSAIELEIKRWSAWAPGVEDAVSWREWANGERAIDGPAKPDVRFVEPLMRRRLSRLGRMTFRVASDCSRDEEPRPLGVFCSRYGEFSRAADILSDIAKGDPVSPKAFSLSVHNTSSSLFSIMQGDRAHSTALASGDTTLEAGFIECWSLLKEGAASTALLVYSDQILPEIYADQESDVAADAALALLLSLPQAGEARPTLGLSWRPTQGTPVGLESVENSALRVLRLLMIGGEPTALNTGRLIWTWQVDGPTL